jgi:hypothetical protein
VRRSFEVPPSTTAAALAAAELSADSATATPTSARLTTGPDATAVGIDTTRATSSSASRPSTGADPARACSCRIGRRRHPRRQGGGQGQQPPAAAARGEFQHVRCDTRDRAGRRGPRGQPQQRSPGLLVARAGKQRSCGCPASAVSPSTAIPLANCARVDPVAPGHRSASDRRNECEVVPHPNAVDAATPAMIAWSRLARESKLG